MKDKAYRLGEINRTAALNDGNPLGQKRFSSETGIADHEWKGVYWARWGDALTEAGFRPLEWNAALDEEEILKHLVNLVRKYRRFPTKAEVQLEGKSNKAIPNDNTIRRRLGERYKAISRLRDYCASKEEFADVAALLPTESPSHKSNSKTIERLGSPRGQRPAGHVYLVKSGKLYKIGCSENHWRRKSELHKQTSEGIIEIHTIAAIDDPRGIERYWHERFADKRQHGEWFDLSPDDVTAFKKRKFM